MKKYAAEFIGTFFVMLFGCGSIVVSKLFPNALSSSYIPVVFGVSVATMIYTVGHISGAHFNPAVTIAFWVSKNFPGKAVFPYILSQLFGSLGALLVLVFLFDSEVIKFCLTQPQVGNMALGLSEFIISFILMFVISSVATDTRAEGEFAGLAIGMIVFLGAAVFGPLTGAAMNPVRALAPAIMTMKFYGQGFYSIAPVIGSVTGALSYKKLKEI